MSETRECRRSCKHWSYDMDSEYCAHPQAMAVSWAGVNLNRMLGAPQYKPTKPEKDPAWGACEGHKLWEAP